LEIPIRGALIQKKIISLSRRVELWTIHD
jgi:hypothetical protein